MAIGAGGLVFVGFNADGNDGFAVLATENIAGGEVVFFTDDEWNETTDTFAGSEGTLTWTTVDPIPAGTVITFDQIGGTLSVSATGVSDPGGVTSSGSFGLAGTDEGLYAYQGTIGVPTQFLSFIANDTGSNPGDIPDGMTSSNGYIGISGDEDVMVYTGSTNFASKADALTAIGNTGNWSTQDGSGDQNSDSVAPEFPEDVPTSFLVCFAAGTLIATGEGETPVESLSIGDMVLTEEGTLVPVKWIGKQSVKTGLSCPARMQPVRICSGALGEALPHTDLTVTADHGMVLGGLVINASALVNGTSIHWVPEAELPEDMVVYHVETDAHRVIRANGALTETFVDAGSRAQFDNFQEYLDLYGTERLILEMDRPRVSARRMVPSDLRQRLENRVGVVVRDTRRQA
jgi:hypothetical protein